MKLKEEMKLSGYFWLPSEEDKKVPGILLISSNGDIKLEILGILQVEQNSEKSEYEIPIICGNVENKNYITLEDSFYVLEGSPCPDMISKSKIVSNYAYFGISIKEKDSLVFDKFSFSLDGLSDWIGRINIENTSAQHGKPIEIKYLPQNKIEYNLLNGDKLIFNFPYFLSRPSRFDIQVSQEVGVNLISNKKKSLEDFIELSWKLINFFSFAVNDTLSITDVKVSSKDITRKYNEKTYPIDIETIYKSTNISEQKTTFYNHDMLFCFDDIENTFELKIQNWLENYQTIEPTMNLYFSVKQGNHSYLESEFLFLIQALETYHRRVSNEKYMDDEKYKSLLNKMIKCCSQEHKNWIEGKLKFGNEISLRTRIKKIIEPFKDLIGTSKERKCLIGKIVDTRNYLTHYNEDLSQNAMVGFELRKLNQNLEGLLELSLLKELKFTDIEIDKIFKKIVMKKFKNK